MENVMWVVIPGRVNMHTHHRFPEVDPRGTVKGVNKYLWFSPGVGQIYKVKSSGLHFSFKFYNTWQFISIFIFHENSSCCFKFPHCYRVLVTSSQPNQSNVQQSNPTELQLFDWFPLGLATNTIELTKIWSQSNTSEGSVIEPLFKRAQSNSIGFNYQMFDWLRRTFKTSLNMTTQVPRREARYWNNIS